MWIGICLLIPGLFSILVMSIIDKILGDIDRQIKCESDWHVEIVVSGLKDKNTVNEVYLWNAESHEAAKAIKDYLVAMGMTDGVLAEPQGCYIRVVRR